MKTYRYENSQKLFARAAKVIPCGIYGHFSPAPLIPTSAYPFYVERAKKAHFWDVDGNEFIDYMCAYGPMVLGYGYEPVDRVVREQVSQADCTSAPAKVMVELAEYLSDLVQGGAWSYFAKNGNDVTTYALMVARAATGRDRIVRVAGGYHGVAPWTQTDDHPGVTQADTSNNLTVQWNDPEGFKQLVSDHKGEIAAFIATPYHHPTFQDSELPAPGYWKSVQEICNREGIVLVVDDVRCGFRLDIRGSHAYFGFQPDLVCFCKAISNGHPISALVGVESLKNAASKVFYTGSYWFTAGPMAGALATMKELERVNGPKVMQARGKELTDGLADLARSYGFTLKVSGVHSMPFLRLVDDETFTLHQDWCAECTLRGAYFTSHHNWFLSVAHTSEDIKRTLEIADEAFQVVKKNR